MLTQSRHFQTHVELILRNILNKEIKSQIIEISFMKIGYKISLKLNNIVEYIHKLLNYKESHKIMTFT